MAVALLVFAPAAAAAAPAQKRTPRGARKSPPAATPKAVNAAAADASADFYSCPMHPSVKSKTPGSCPKCKMDLRPVRAEVGGAGAHDGPAPDAHAGHTPTAAAGGAPRMSIPDVELLDQDGRKIHFYTDLVKGKTVAINFIFTTCTTICPPLGATFARVQKELGERVGRDVHFISVSVDPATDTPERLKAWGEKFRAGAGWTFVTGSKPQVDELLRALGTSVAQREDHSPTILIGNDAKGQWTRTYGLAKPSQLVNIIGEALDGRLGTTTEANKK